MKGEVQEVRIESPGCEGLAAQLLGVRLLLLLVFWGVSVTQGESMALMFSENLRRSGFVGFRVLDGLPGRELRRWAPSCQGIHSAFRGRGFRGLGFRV